jgi:hypothetical protein
MSGQMHHIHQTKMMKRVNLPQYRTLSRPHTQIVILWTMTLKRLNGQNKMRTLADRIFNSIRAQKAIRYIAGELGVGIFGANPE